MAVDKLPISQDVCVIATVLNEERNVVALLNALSKQSVLPHLVVVADGGSTDKTQKILKQTLDQYPFKCKWVLEPGNRSVGRNAAVAATGNCPLIAITDAGCFPHESWLAELLRERDASRCDLIAGYYQVFPASTPFQLAAAPFFLVMPDKIDEKTFLPATRSMLITRKAFLQLGGFDEQLSDNEDYAFARKAVDLGITRSFTKKAVVDWQPPSTAKTFFYTIFRFARGDAQAKLYRPKVALVFARYVLGLLVVIPLLLYSAPISILFVLVALLLYSAWVWLKLAKYVPRGKAWLPALQILADIAVQTGSMTGWWRRRMMSR